MNRRKFSIPPPYLAVALALIVLGSVLLAGCTSQTGAAVSAVTSAPASASANTLPDGVTVTKLEVFHFHPTRPCKSCTMLGDNANATVTTSFAKELKSGKVVFRHVNYQLPENQEIVKQYGANSSSLWLGAYTSDGGFHLLRDTKGLSRSGDLQRYMDSFRVVIERRLAGDLSRE